MTVFKTFLKVLNKNKGMIFMYMGIFIGLILMMGRAQDSDSFLSFSDASVRVAIVDRDDSELSQGLSSYLNEYHKIQELPDNKEILQDELFYRGVEYILFVPEGFEEDFLNGGNIVLENVKLPESTSGIYVDNQIDQYLKTFRVYLDAEIPLNKALEYTQADMEITTDIVIDQKASSEQSSTFYFQYASYILLVIMISVLGPILIVFNKTDLKRRMECTALRLKSKNAQIALGCFVTAFGVWSIFMIVAVIFYGEEMFTQAALLRMGNSIMILLISVALAFLTGQFLKSVNALAGISNVIGLGMSFLCGVFVPQSLLGDNILFAAKFLPVYWYVRTNDALAMASDITEKQLNIFMEGIVIQLAFAVAIFAVALVISRKKQHANIA